MAAPERCNVEISFSQYASEEDLMGRAALLWFLGVPIPVLLLMWMLGWLH